MNYQLDEMAKKENVAEDARFGLKRQKMSESNDNRKSSNETNNNVVVQRPGIVTPEGVLQDKVLDRADGLHFEAIYAESNFCPGKENSGENGETGGLLANTLKNAVPKTDKTSEKYEEIRKLKDIELILSDDGRRTDDNVSGENVKSTKDLGCTLKKILSDRRRLHGMSRKRKEDERQKSPKKGDNFESLLTEVAEMVKQLHNSNSMIQHLKEDMKANIGLEDHFKKVILTQQEKFRRDIWKNQKAIMRGYDEMLGTCSNPSDVAMRLSKKTQLTIEEVDRVISRCILVEDMYNKKSTMAATGKYFQKCLVRDCLIDHSDNFQMIKSKLDKTGVSQAKERGEDSPGTEPGTSTQSGKNFELQTMANARTSQQKDNVHSTKPSYAPQQLPKEVQNAPRHPEAVAFGHPSLRPSSADTQLTSAVNRPSNTSQITQAEGLTPCNVNWSLEFLSQSSVGQRPPFVPGKSPCQVPIFERLQSGTKGPPVRTPNLISPFRQILGATLARPTHLPNCSLGQPVRPPAYTSHLTPVLPLQPPSLAHSTVHPPASVALHPPFNSYLHYTVRSVQGEHSIGNYPTEGNPSQPNSGPEVHATAYPNVYPRQAVQYRAIFPKQRVPNQTEQMSSRVPTHHLIRHLPVGQRSYSDLNMEAHTARHQVVSVQQSYQKERSQLDQSRGYSVPPTAYVSTGLQVRPGDPNRVVPTSVPHQQENVEAYQNIPSGPHQTTYPTLPLMTSSTFLSVLPPFGHPPLLSLQPSNPPHHHVPNPSATSGYQQYQSAQQPTANQRLASFLHPSWGEATSFPSASAPQSVASTGCLQYSPRSASPPLRSPGHPADVALPQQPADEPVTPHDPTIPQKLTLKNQRLQAGEFLIAKDSEDDGVDDHPVAVKKEAMQDEEEIEIIGEMQAPSCRSTSRVRMCAQAQCMNIGVKICDGCCSVIYCSDTCQLKHWKLKHGNECYKLKELRGV